MEKTLLKSLLEQATAVVLAGGLGTRIKSLYPNLPKPMIPVNGRPFIEWVLRYLLKQGVRRAVISSGHLAEVIQKYCESQPVKGMEVQCVAEPSPMGTAGGFLHAVAGSEQKNATRIAASALDKITAEYLEEQIAEHPKTRSLSQLHQAPAHSKAEKPPAWLVLNGDSLVLADLGIAASVMSDPEVESVVMGIEVPDTSRYGKLRFDCSGQLLHFAEKEPGRGIVNAGVYFFRDALLEKFPAQRPLSFEKDVFPALLLKQTEIKVCVASGAFLDIGTPASLAQAEAFIQQNIGSFQI